MSREFDISNRRYIGSKTLLSDWIFEKIRENCTGNSFFDVFAGTAIISKKALEYFDNLIINDFLYSNQIIYKAFFISSNYDKKRIEEIVMKFNKIKDLNSNYFDQNFANKYFGYFDAKKIGYIREEIENLYKNKKINIDEYNILLASLIFSFDRIANTVGHYEAYRKVAIEDNKFEMRLIKPIDTKGKQVKIYREDSNELAKRVYADIAFVDPPYNSRQYSRFYHLIENLVQWNKPTLHGVALKPKEQNMSEYCRFKANEVFDDLIKSLNCKYIVTTYNNTYSSKSSSSKNKISLDQIMKSLNENGQTQVFEKPHKFFNAGKTDFSNHKEYLFITKKEDRNES